MSSKNAAFWRDKPILITGASGLVGAELTLNLVKQGAQVIALVRDFVPLSSLFSGQTHHQITLVQGEITDQQLLNRVFLEYEIDTCFHLAAQTQVLTANHSPISTFESNIRGTWTVLEAARLWGNTRRIIIASSDKAYGIHKQLPYTEDAPLQGRYAYDCSKSCTDLIAQSYFHTFGLPVVITRCGNIFGPGDLNWSRLIPGTIRSLFHQERPVIRSDGKLRRDYLFVNDIVEAYLLCAEFKNEAKVLGEAFNFGLDDPKSVKEIVELISQVSQTNLSPIIENRDLKEIPDQYLDSSKAKKLLKWQPKQTLESGLSKTYDWYSKFLANQ